MMKRLVIVALGISLMQGALFAQNPPPPPAPPPKPAAAPARPAPPPPPPPPPRAASESNIRNVRLELRITDTYSGSPVEKTVSMIIRDGHSGRIRTSAIVPGAPEGVLNVDAITNATADGKHISAVVTIEYRPASASNQHEGLKTFSPVLQESVNVILRNGQPLVVTQSADPVSDRKVTLELTATILQ